MARALNSLTGRIVVTLIGAHAVLLPALYFGVLSVVRSGQEDAFVDHVRASTRIFADLLEAEGTVRGPGEIANQLDSMILGGRCTFASLEIGGRIYESTLIAGDDAVFIEDFGFGQNGDEVYYMSASLALDGVSALLRLGFDETPTLQQINDVRSTLTNVVIVYFLATLGFGVVLARILVRPLHRLALDSREIASGDYARHLSATSDIREIGELARDLETMRSNIVGVNARLQSEIAEREAAEAEQRQLETRLRHSQRLESIGTLAGGIAHEFNNVLLPLILYADLALEDVPEDSPARTHLERVLELGNRAKGLSRQILTFGRHAEESESSQVEIARVVEEALSLVRALIPASIDITMAIDATSGTVRCNAAEIHQLVVNLCSNAYLALQSGGGQIRVGIGPARIDSATAGKYPQLGKGSWVCLEVTDTGEGMDPATIERIFEPFFTTRGVGKGTGLGLSVVHGIVTKHGGEIIVSSTLGKGTTVAVYFPLSASGITPDQEREQQ